MDNEKKKELISRINNFIDNDRVLIEDVFDFDDDIKIAVEEYKTVFSNGYCTTLQTIRVGDYVINCHHDHGEKLVAKAEMLRESINEVGIEKTIERYTKGDEYSKNIKEWIWHSFFLAGKE